MKGQRWIRVLGVGMVGLAIVGFATVADDLRHVGEFLGVASVLVGGLAFLASTGTTLSRWVALEWLPLGLALGLALGAATDNMHAGTGAGLAVGLLLAWLRRRKPRST